MMGRLQASAQQESIQSKHDGLPRASAPIPDSYVAWTLPGDSCAEGRLPSEEDPLDSPAHFSEDGSQKKRATFSFV